jgi:hypothetical protein
MDGRGEPLLPRKVRSIHPFPLRVWYSAAARMMNKVMYYQIRIPYDEYIWFDYLKNNHQDERALLRSWIMGLTVAVGLTSDMNHIIKYRNCVSLASFKCTSYDVNTTPC